MKKREYILNLINEINSATAEYNKGHPIMSDKQWDDKFDELATIEKETGIVYSFSPTQSVQFDFVDSLKKVEHNHPMLSLDKTKSIEDLISFADHHKICVMAKMDGLTCSLRYVNGKLISAETRGNGTIGEDISHNIKGVKGVPQVIPNNDELIVDGEIICDYENFKKHKEEGYSNPRNYAAGSIRLLDSKECSKRDLSFIAWDAFTPRHSEYFHPETHSDKLNILEVQFGFTVVPFIASLILTDVDSWNTTIESIKLACNEKYPIDGIVIKFDDIEYYQSLGATSHHFRGGIAYKFYDETYPSELISITYNVSRNGILTPVANFTPIEMDGSIVSRASLHNMSVMKEILGKPYVGQKLEVMKANMIIPQIYSAEKADEGEEFIDVPEVCPVCGSPVMCVTEASATVLHCSNEKCQSRFINRVDYFCGKNGLDIKGLSEKTIEDLVEWGWLKDLTDLFKLDSHRSDWVKKEGYGEASVDAILKAIAASKEVNLETFLSSLGIPLIGKNVSKKLVSYIASYEDFRDKINNKFDFSKYDGFGESKTKNLLTFDYSEADEVSKYLVFKENKIEQSNNQSLSGITVVITGSLNEFKNRNELINAIANAGGKVASSVSKKTNYLINNDISSSSAKNEKAKSLGVEIISEKDFICKFL